MKADSWVAYPDQIFAGLAEWKTALCYGGAGLSHNSIKCDYKFSSDLHCEKYRNFT